MRYGWPPFVVINLTSSIGLSAGLSAAENTFRLGETTIAEIHEAVAAGALSSERLVELYLARIAAYDRSGPRLNSIIYINPNAKAEAAALDKERVDKGPRGPLPAEMLELEKSLGSIAPGYFADIVAVEGDPLANIDVVVKNVRWVTKGGVVVVDKTRAPHEK